jgi:hypothetical protein
MRIITKENRIVIISDKEITEKVEIILLAKFESKDIKKTYTLIKGKKGSLIIN